MNNIFYVYEWIRLDRNEPFYVGKGKRNRYKDLRMRNKWFLNIVNKLGLEKIEIRKIEENLSEEEAFEKEKYYIKKYREYGIDLCNMTDGGEGSSNWYSSLSEEEKENHRLISRSFLGKTHSEETKLKMSNSAKGRTLSLETRAKLSKIAKGRDGYWKDKHLPKEVRDKIREKAKGRPSPLKGRKLSEEVRVLAIEHLKKATAISSERNKKRLFVIKDNAIIYEFNSRRECTSFFENRDNPISESYIKKLLKENTPLPINNKNKHKHKEYENYIFIYEEDYNKTKL